LQTLIAVFWGLPLGTYLEFLLNSGIVRGYWAWRDFMYILDRHAVGPDKTQFMPQPFRIEFILSYLYFFHNAKFYKAIYKIGLQKRLSSKRPIVNIMHKNHQVELATYY
jgi:hypothetical protein